ncbi:hypothetical protein CCUS01_04999 [Colletotrichum cuscutae]|uniref:Uncharacterized protein n=1 Tax=Colletotrichum cuscutae TaxID=1209917 RepID=A0AAI9VAU6_9PEZI|nr:hypothetical protein CCUS01_04999 [Colletotrichum cuscutae]
MPHTVSPSRLPASGVLIRYQTLTLCSFAACRPTRPRSSIPLPCLSEPFLSVYRLTTPGSRSYRTRLYR